MRTLLLAAAWLAGIAALASGSTAAQIAVGAGTAGLCLVVYRDRRGVFLGAATLTVLLLAWWRWEAVSGPLPGDSVAWLATEERRVLVGRVVSDAQASTASQRLTVAVERVVTVDGERAASGRVQIRVAPSVRLRRGDTVRLEGTLERPPMLDGFDYPRYLARRDIYAVMEYPRVRVSGRSEMSGVGQALQRLRDRAHTAFWRNLPAQEAGLAEGMLIGRRTDIPREVNESFQRSGVSHLIVISGFNIALVGGMVMSAAAWLAGRRWAALLALGAIGSYSLLVGLSPPVARAAVMGSVAILALLSGRPHGGGVALVLAAALLTLPDPRIVEEISFQLSVAATAGLIVLAPPAMSLGRRWIHEEEATHRVTWRSLALAGWDVLAVTLAATAATLPILLASFGRLSAVSPLTNLLLVPLFPLVIVAGAFGLAVALIVPPLGATALAPVGALLDVSIGVARAMASLPGAALTLDWFTPAHAAVAYLLLGIAAFRRLPGRPRGAEAQAWHTPAPLTARPLALLALAPAAVLLLMTAGTVVRSDAGDRRTTVSALGLSSSSVALVRLPGGATVLVDAGLAPGAARAELDREVRGGRALTAVVITRDAASARGGLMDVIARWRPPLLLVPPDAEDSAWVEAARASGVRVLALRPDLTLGGVEAHLQVEGPRDGEWRLSVRHGARTIAIGAQAGDASLTRSNRLTRVAATGRGLRTEIDLRPGERVQVSTDGRSVRLVPPRGRSLTAIRCLSTCDTAAR